MISSAGYLRYTSSQREHERRRDAIAKMSSALDDVPRRPYELADRCGLSRAYFNLYLSAWIRHGGVEIVTIRDGYRRVQAYRLKL